LLNSGSALGHGCGPLLICKDDAKIDLDQLSGIRVAIPGKYTTANLLLGFGFPEINKKEAFLFSEIEDAVLSGKVDAGVIIHENRFTYQDKGLKLLADLGDLWESKTGFMIPLGGIAIKRDLPEEIKLAVDALLKSSVAFAWENEAVVMPYVAQHAQEMSESVMKQHIELYVNEFTQEIGKDGKLAVEYLYEVGERLGITPSIAGKALFTK
jgi:1,4-dihydroxy-6-naphthoate synthase